jgi:hypothetical protein
MTHYNKYNEIQVKNYLLLWFLCLKKWTLCHPFSSFLNETHR